MSSLTSEQLARIEQNRQAALARLASKQPGTPPPTCNSQITCVSQSVVRNLFESPPRSHEIEEDPLENIDLNQFRYTENVSPDSHARGAKRSFVDIDATAGISEAKIQAIDHSELLSQSTPLTQSTPTSSQQSTTRTFASTKSIFGTTKHTPGKNANIANMIKSMVPISPEKKEQLLLQKKQRTYSPLLSEEQCRVMDLVLDGKSVFFTGSAGTGKSFLLREIVKELRKVKAEETVFVTATTGIAACNIGGSTIHSFAGIGYGEETREKLATKIANKTPNRKRWIKCKVLIIDEISMLAGKLFDKLEYIARSVRKIERPFGGIQVILCGDFFQLPPVVKKAELVDFCFEAQSWDQVVTHSVELTKVFRQADERFVRILNEIRHGFVSNEADAAFRATINNPPRISSADGHEIVATRLEPFKREVSAENYKRLNDLPGETVFFKAIDKGDKEHLKTLEQNCAAPTELELKVDAQVILLKNLSAAKDLVNGSRGVVVGFQQVRDERRGEDRTLPVVKFASGVATVGIEEWIIEMGGKVVASRLQIPLALAWCLSIHKSQGQTIELVEMNLSNVFECGQAYVALSRAVSLQGLRVLSFDRNKIKAHPKVASFYKSLSRTIISTPNNNISPIKTPLSTTNNITPPRNSPNNSNISPNISPNSNINSNISPNSTISPNNRISPNKINNTPTNTYQNNTNFDANCNNSTCTLIPPIPNTPHASPSANSPATSPTILFSPNSSANSYSNSSSANLSPISPSSANNSINSNNNKYNNVNNTTPTPTTMRTFSIEDDFCDEDFLSADPDLQLSNNTSTSNSETTENNTTENKTAENNNVIENTKPLITSKYFSNTPTKTRPLLPRRSQTNISPTNISPTNNSFHSDNQNNSNNISTDDGFYDAVLDDNDNDNDNDDEEIDPVLSLDLTK